MAPCNQSNFFVLTCASISAIVLVCGFLNHRRKVTAQSKCARKRWKSLRKYIHNHKMSKMRALVLKDMDARAPGSSELAIEAQNARKKITSELERDLEHGLENLSDIDLAAWVGRAQGILDESVLAKARSCLKSRWDDKCPNAESDKIYGNEISYESHGVAQAASAFVLKFALQRKPAKADIQYWASDQQPWRKGAKREIMTDADEIVAEEAHRQRIIAEDASTVGTIAHARKLRSFGVRVDFLLAITAAADIWAWPVWEVVEYIIKPMTEQRSRCRASEMEEFEGYIGPATVFMSHCWGGLWGNLVMAACVGASSARYVWIDVFAVRQWPGNTADLDFRGVISGCSSLIAAGGVQQMKSWSLFNPSDRKAYLISEDYERAQKSLPMCRLWCVVELYAALDAELPVVFKFGTAVVNKEQKTVAFNTTGAANMMTSLSYIVDLSQASCAVAADRERELATIGEKILEVNEVVAEGLRSGAVGDVVVDAFTCGEANALWRVIRFDAPPSLKLTNDLLCSAAAAGAIMVVRLILGCHPSLLSKLCNPTDEPSRYPLHESKNSEMVDCLIEYGFNVDMKAGLHGNKHTPVHSSRARCSPGVTRSLLEHGANPDLKRTVNGIAQGAVIHMVADFAFPNCVEIMKCLVEFGADTNITTGAHYRGLDAKRSTDGQMTPLMSLNFFDADPDANARRLEMARLLLAHGADIKKGTPMGRTPLHQAVEHKCAEVVKLYLSRGADPNALNGESEHTTYPPLFVAVQQGDTHISRMLLEHGAQVNAVQSNLTPLLLAVFGCDIDIVRMLLEYGADPNLSASQSGRSPLELCEGHADRGDIRNVFLGQRAVVSAS